MPAVQIVNSARQPEVKPEPTAVEQLFSKYKSYANERREGDEIQKLTNQYLQNKDQEGAWEKLQFDLMNSKEIGPTKRLETQQQLKEIRSQILDERKTLADKAKEIKANEERKRKRESLKAAGATEEQLDLYEAASVGGETKIMEKILDDIARTSSPEGLVSKDVIDKDKGLTPKERVARQDDRFKIQTPLVNQNNDSLKALESENLSISLLEELDDSGKVGEGLQNLNINPINGNLIVPKLATKEEQLFVKTVNDFTVKAKDSFGARVTNFELDRFMQRLPTLANSSEGRKLIMRQMKIVNETNALEKRALQQIFDKYGVRNIDYADAENEARKSIQSQKEQLRQEYLNLEEVARKQEREVESKLKSKVKEGYTAMRKPDGSIKQFPNDNVPNLEEKGYKRL
jgi:hypothetical protein